MTSLALALSRLVVVAGLGAALTGCAWDRTSPAYLGKGDTKPHPGVALAYSYPVHGIDVSRYQGEIDWTAVRNAGARFVWIKGTEGGDFLDERFQTNWVGAKAAGVPYGFYHLMYWCRPASEQMDWIRRNIPADPKALPPVLDLEWNSQSRTCPSRPDSATARAQIDYLLAEMERYFGRRPIIYTDISFHKEVLEGYYNNYSYWLRSVAAHPSERYNRSKFHFWQYTSTGSIPGIRGPVDRNVFYGSETQWRSFLSPSSQGTPVASHE